MDTLPLIKETFCENQVLAKAHIIILVEKADFVRNHIFSVLDHTSQTQDMERNISTDFSFNTLLFLCFVVGEQRLHFRHCPPVGRRRALMCLLRVAPRTEFENRVVLVNSCVHDRQRPREMIDFTDNSRFLSRIQMRGYG